MRDNDYLPPQRNAPPTVAEAFNVQADDALIRRLGVDWCIDNIRPDSINGKLKDFVEKLYNNRVAILQRKVGVYVWGTNSIGKSYATAFACKALASAGYSCLWLTVNQLIDCYLRRDDYRFDDSTLYNRVLSVHFLFVDDIGKETNNQNIASLVERILRERLQNTGRYSATIITSNIAYPTEENRAMLHRYGEGMTTLIRRSTLSRLVDDQQQRRDNVQQLATEIA